MDQPCAADQAHSPSHSPSASDALSVCPSKLEFRIEAGLFRTLILERFRLPMQMTENVCEYGSRWTALVATELRAVAQEDSSRGR